MSGDSRFKRTGDRTGRLSRCLRLFYLLDDADVGLTSDHLAQELEVSRRSIQRYLLDLEAAGCIIDRRQLDSEQHVKGAAVTRYRVVRRKHLAAAS